MFILNIEIAFILLTLVNNLLFYPDVWISTNQRYRAITQDSGDISGKNLEFYERLEMIKAQEIKLEERIRKVEEREERIKDEEQRLEQRRIEQEKDKKDLETSWNYIFFIALVVIILMIICFLTGRKLTIVKDSQLRRKAQRGNVELDVCHLSLTRERNMFFKNILMQKLAESNVRPTIDYAVLHKPSDFNTIPPAKCYIVHWTSQRMSIFSDNWTHRGLLRALVDTPVMILVYDSEQMETLPDGELCDRNFRQIETETELIEAMREQRLITYRANERFNRTQEQALKNWVNANTSGEPLKV